MTRQATCYYSSRDERGEEMRISGAMEQVQSMDTLPNRYRGDGFHLIQR